MRFDKLCKMILNEGDELTDAKEFNQAATQGEDNLGPMPDVAGAPQDDGMSGMPPESEPQTEGSAAGLNPSEKGDFLVWLANKYDGNTEQQRQVINDPEKLKADVDEYHAAVEGGTAGPDVDLQQPPIEEPMAPEQGLAPTANESYVRTVDMFNFAQYKD